MSLLCVTCAYRSAKVTCYLDIDAENEDHYD
jgi:hypothetical protein